MLKNKEWNSFSPNVLKKNSLHPFPFTFREKSINFCWGGKQMSQLELIWQKYPFHIGKRVEYIIKNGNEADLNLDPSQIHSTWGRFY